LHKPIKQQGGRQIIKLKEGGVTHISEMRPLLSIFDPPQPLSIRQKIFAFLEIEDGEYGISLLREMAKQNESFLIFITKVALYAQNESTYEYADDLQFFDDLFR